jgi:hypothetical protein
MSETETFSVCFSLDGQFYTDLMRDWVSEGRWKEAYNSLLEDMEGMDHKMAVSILKGEKAIGGNSTDGMELIDQDQDCPRLKSFNEVMDHQFKRIFYRSGTWYKAYAIVTSWCERDMCYARRHHDIGRVIPYTSAEKEELSRCRSLYYADDWKKTEAFVTNKGVILAEETSVDVPMWLLNDMKNERNLTIAIPFVQERGSRIDEEREKLLKMHEVEVDEVEVETIEAADVPSYREEIQEMTEAKDEHAQEAEAFYKRKLAIKEQADSVEDGWVEIFDMDGENSWTVARGALQNWALRNWRDTVDCVEWNPVFPSGFKMYGDDPYHTDLIVSGDINLLTCGSFYEDHKEFNDALYHNAHKLQEEMLGFEIMVLAGS